MRRMKTKTYPYVTYFHLLGILIILSCLVLLSTPVRVAAKPLSQESDNDSHPEEFRLEMKGESNVKNEGTKNSFSDETDFSLLSDPSSSESGTKKNGETGSSVIVSGKLGEKITWTLQENGLLSFTGSGAMITDACESSSSLDSEKIPWYEYHNMITEVSVGSGITSIGDGAFTDCKNLNKVTLPDSLSEIGYWAFSDCLSLTNITLPGSIRTFKTACFSEAGLTEITFPEGVKELGEYICQKCASLEKISLPNTLEVIHKGAFTRCTALEGILVFPDNVTSIEGYAFYESSYRAVRFNSKLTSIGTQVFYNNSSLENITFLGNAPTIDEAAFKENTVTVYYPSSDSSWTSDHKVDYGGTITWEASDGSFVSQGVFEDTINWALGWDGTLEISGEGSMPVNNSIYSIPWRNYMDYITHVTVGTGITNLADYSFCGCTSLTEVSLPDSVTKISDNAFENCSSLAAVNFLDHMDAIGSYAFSGCSALTEIEIPNRIVSIGDNAFQKCSSLRTVIIGSGTTSISGNAFLDCDSLQSFKVSQSNSAYTSIDGYLCKFDGTSLHILPSGLKEVMIPAGIKTIPYQAIYENDVVEKVKIPASVESIGSYNLTACPNIQEVTVDPENTHYSVYHNCLYDYEQTVLLAAYGSVSKLEANDFPSSVKEIGNYAFFKCSNLKSVVLPEGLIKIGYESFSRCTLLESITLPDTITDIGEEAFYYCVSLRSVDLPDSLSKISSHLFYGCNDLEEVQIPDSVTYIGYDAFCNCKSLFQVLLPEALTGYGSTPFYACDNLEAIVFKGNAPENPNKLASSYMSVTIYYPEESSGWSSLAAATFGDKATLSPYSNGDYMTAIHEKHIVIPEGWTKTGCYELADNLFTYTNTNIIFRQYCVNGTNGLYILYDKKLLFFDQADGSIDTLKVFSTIKDCYETEGILYITDGKKVFRYDLRSKCALSTVYLPGSDSIMAIGVDKEGCYYSASADTGGSRYILALHDSDGNLLSSTKVSEQVYRFVGFDSSNGKFYMESETNYYSWGYDHYGHGLTMGEVSNNKISYLETSNSFLESGLISRSVDCLEYLCQEFYLLHQVSAELLEGRYLVSTSNLHNRILLIDSNSSAAKWDLARELDSSGLPSSYYDTSSIGVRALIQKTHNSILIADNDKHINEYDLETKEDLYSYPTSHPVFALSRMGDMIVALEREGNTFYLETIDISDPAEVIIEGTSTMKVGETQQLHVNMASRSYTSSNASVVTVDRAGIVSAWKQGTATITVNTVDGRSKQLTIQVIASDHSDISQPAHSSDGVITNNQSDNNYTVWSQPMNSYLAENNDGTYTRVEYVPDKGIIVENYGTDWKCKSKKTIGMELPLFGGFFSGNDNYYIVYGQQNEKESDDTEVVRVVKYSKSWTKLGETSIKGANTYCPFDAGCLRMTETAGKLYVYTCHEMYASDDGLHHQSNMTYVINEADMALVDSYYDILNISQAGYVSHSFNQFIRTDGNHVYRVDHGDANPRAISITKCEVDGKVTSVDYMNVYKINGGYGANATGVSIGGLELSSNTCLITGNSVDMSDASNYSANGTRNVFVAVTDKKLTRNSILWLTDYEEGSEITVNTPQLVKISPEQFLVMWEEYDSTTRGYRTRFVTLDNQGNKINEQFSRKVRLSDCQPIYTKEGHVVWYVTNGSAMTFHEVNPYDLTSGLTTDLNKCNVTLTYGNSTVDIKNTLTASYTGEDIKPKVVIKNNNTTLIEQEDYTVSYQNNRDAGKAEITILGKGEYSGIISASFIIEKASQKIDFMPNGLNVVVGQEGSFHVTGFGQANVRSTDENIIKLTSSEEEPGTQSEPAINPDGSYTTRFSCLGISQGSASLEISVTGDENHAPASASIKVDVLAEAIHISQAEATLSQDSYVYDGTLKKPAVQLTYMDKTLTEGKDYVIRYSNNQNAGTGIVTIYGIGGYTGAMDKTFLIRKANQDLLISPSRATILKGKNGLLTVRGIGSITADSDNADIMSIEEDSADENTVTFKYTGIGKGSTNLTFRASGNENYEPANKTIPAKVVSSLTSLKGAAIVLKQATYTYDGTEKHPEVTIKNQGETLVQDEDYRLSYSDNVNAGTATVYVTGIGTYTGSTSTEFTINPRPLSNANIIFTKIGTILYSEYEDSWAVVDGNKLLSERRDYHWSNMSAGYDSDDDHVTYLWIRLEGLDNYTGILEQTIKPVSSKATLKSARTDSSGTILTWIQETGAAGYYIYRSNGGTYQKVKTITNKKTTSWKDKDVTNPSAGYTYYIECYTMSGKRILRTSPSAIKKTDASDKTKNKITASDKKFVYSSSARTFSLGAKCLGGVPLSYKSSGRISVDSKGRVKIPAKAYGKYYITISSADTIHYFAASKKVCISIVPSTPALKTAKAAKGRKINVKWAKSPGAHGYQIQYSTKKNFTSGNKSIGVRKASASKYTVTNCKKGKTYYVRIRAYFKTGGKKVYSGWSTAKKVKVKR